MGGSRDPRFPHDLVRGAQAGDRDAFRLLMEEARPRLTSLIHLRLGPRLRQRVEVEDVFQEVCLEAFKSLRQFEWRDGGSFFRWLRGIAEHMIKNLARHHFGTLKREGFREVPLSPGSGGTGSTGPEGGLAAEGVSPGRVLRRKERFERLERALDSLSRDHRRVIVLARVEGLSMKEIARQMDRSVDAASMLLLRALRQLKAHFGTTDSLHLPSLRLGALSQDGDGEGRGPSRGPGE